MRRARSFLGGLAVLLTLTGVSRGQENIEFPAEMDKDFPAKLKAAIELIKPLPLKPIPDDPPPHEGAFIDLTYVIEPPDLLLVEVLEALPGLSDFRQSDSSGPGREDQLRFLR